VRGLIGPAGERTGEHRGVAVGDEQAEATARLEHTRHGSQRGRRVVDDLEHRVAQDQVDALRGDQGREV
jgi:hypothetical protein